MWQPAPRHAMIHVLTTNVKGHYTSFKRHTQDTTYQLKCDTQHPDMHWRTNYKCEMTLNVHCTSKHVNMCFVKLCDTTYQSVTPNTQTCTDVLSTNVIWHYMHFKIRKHVFCCVTPRTKAWQPTPRHAQMYYLQTWYDTTCTSKDINMCFCVTPRTK